MGTTTMLRRQYMVPLLMQLTLQDEHLIEVRNMLTWLGLSKPDGPGCTGSV